MRRSWSSVTLLVYHLGPSTAVQFLKETLSLQAGLCPRIQSPIWGEEAVIVERKIMLTRLHLVLTETDQLWALFLPGQVKKIIPGMGVSCGRCCIEDTSQNWALCGAKHTTAVLRTTALEFYMEIIFVLKSHAWDLCLFLPRWYLFRCKFLCHPGYSPARSKINLWGL